MAVRPPRPAFRWTIVELAGRQTELRVVSDQIGAPTSSDVVACMTAVAIPQILAFPERQGTYHLTAAGETNWCD